MSAGAQLSVTDKRRATRHTVDYTVLAEHRQLGELELHIVNISGQGFMIQGEPAIERGERLVIRLPVVGRIEAHLIWDCQDFRVWPGIMGNKESHYVTTQRTCHTE